MFFILAIIAIIIVGFVIYVALNAKNMEIIEFDDFYFKIKKTPDLIIGNYLALSVICKIQFYESKMFPEGFFDNYIKGLEKCDLGCYELTISKCLRSAQLKNNTPAYIGTMILKYTYLTMYVPDFKQRGRELWKELMRGRPFIEYHMNDFKENWTTLLYQWPGAWKRAFDPSLFIPVFLLQPSSHATQPPSVSDPQEQ